MIGLFLPPGALDTSKKKYAMNFIKIIDNKLFRDKLIVLTYYEHFDFVKSKCKNITTIVYGQNKTFFFLNRIFRKIGIPSKPDFYEPIKKHKINFCIFLNPTYEIIFCKTPFAASFQSLGYRLNPELNECASEKTWQIAHSVAHYVANNAKLIFIDSYIGKEYLKTYFDKVNDVVVLPHILPEDLFLNVSNNTMANILHKFSLEKNKYLFYPAQLWPHKNHMRILEAIRLLKKRGICLKIVFTAASEKINKTWGVKKLIQTFSNDYGLSDSIIFTGLINSDEMKTLYCNALALIMPQLIPEPCIPFAEAMALKCPIIGSNIPGIKEQIESGGLLVNPYDVGEICDAIELIYTSDSIRKDIVDNATKKYLADEIIVKESSVYIEEFLSKLLLEN